MVRWFTIVLALSIVVGVAIARPLLLAGPTTQPGDGPAVVRLVQALNKVELTDQQLPRVEGILSNLREAIERVRKQARRQNPQDLREEIRKLHTQTREQLLGTLSAEQVTKLKRLLDEPEDEPRKSDRETPSPPSSEKTNDKPSAVGGKPGAVAGKPDAPATQPGEAVLNVGDVLPEFTLVRVDGRSVTRQSLQGKPVVFLFGSYTSPSFRDRMPALIELSKKLGNRVTFVVLYTREAHPKGQWEVQRNIDEEIYLDQHQSLDDRMAAARLARDKLGIPFDVLPDPMNDAMTKLLKGFPNAAVVVDAKGTIIARQKWMEPTGIEIHLESLER
jgi:thiol-disulfide isomerase/thioredoxin